MTLVEKYSMRNIDFELLKESSLKAKNDLVEQMNLVNELEKELSDRGVQARFSAVLSFNHDLFEQE